MKNVIIKTLFSLSIISLMLTGCTAGSLSGTSWPGIAYGDETVYTAYGSEVYALNGKDGSLLWKYPAEKANAAISYYAAPGITEDGQVIICDYKGTVTSLDQTTGTQKWTFATSDRIVADPLVVGSTSYIASADYFLYALDNQGKLIWKYQTQNHLWAKPMFANGVIYQNGMDHNLYAINADNGNLMWKVDLGGSALGSPVMDKEGVIYGSTLGKEILAISPSSQQIMWRHTTSDSIWSGLVEKDGILYFGDLSGNFTALDTNSQQPAWQYKAGGAIVSTPLLLEDMLLFTSEDGNLYGLDYSGQPVMTQKLAEKLYASPVANGGNFLIGITEDKEKIMTAVNNNGPVVWSFQTPK